MMGRKQFSYPNLGNIKTLFILSTQYLFFREKFSKNYSRRIFFKMLLFNYVHPSLYLWTHEMGVRNGILINCKKTMNNLLQIREKIKRANRLYQAQLLATKNGEVTPYKRSVFEERIRKTQKEMKSKDSKN